MTTPNKWEVLETCTPAAEENWQRHAFGFVSSFIVPAKRDRWLDLLTRRPKQIRRNSHKLHSALDRRFCRCEAEAVVIDWKGEGLFYDFFDVPRVVPANVAEIVANGTDAIFSLIPGELAVYFFHESEVWLCRAKPPGRHNK